MTIPELIERVGKLTPGDECFADDFTTLKWVFHDHWSGESATYKAAGFSAYVKDYDGDSSGWVVRHRGNIIAEGENWDHSPPHFFICLHQAEIALRQAAAATLSALQQKETRT